MIPNPREKKQTAGFPLEKAKKMYAMFGPDGQDMTFAQFYKELCSLNDEGQMKKDLECIQMARMRECGNKAAVERALQNASN